jgi:hypothetical protein
MRLAHRRVAVTKPGKPSAHLQDAVALQGRLHAVYYVCKLGASRCAAEPAAFSRDSLHARR